MDRIPFTCCKLLARNSSSNVIFIEKACERGYTVRSKEYTASEMKSVFSILSVVRIISFAGPILHLVHYIPLGFFSLIVIIGRTIFAYFSQSIRRSKRPVIGRIRALKGTIGPIKEGIGLWKGVYCTMKEVFGLRNEVRISPFISRILSFTGRISRIIPRIRTLQAVNSLSHAVFVLLQVV